MKIESGAIDLSLFEFKLSPWNKIKNKNKKQFLRKQNENPFFKKTEMIETILIQLQTKHYFTKDSH